MARKLHPEEEIAFHQAAPRIATTQPDGGDAWERRKIMGDPSLDLKPDELSDDLPHWNEVSWPEEWGW